MEGPSRPPERLEHIPCAKASHDEFDVPIGEPYNQILTYISLFMMTTLAILDNHPINPGDADWSPVESQVTVCNIYEQTRPTDVLKHSQDAEIILTNKVKLDASLLSKLKKLRYIGVLATGYDNIDVEAARAQGIVVTYIPAYSTYSVAQTTIALLLEITHRVGHHNQTVHDGKWCKQSVHCYWDYPLIELAGKTLGIIGYGTIGMHVANIAQALGMNLLAYKRTPPNTTPEHVSFVDLATVLAKSDVLSFHTPLTPETHQFINAQLIDKMKQGAILLNASRGGLVDERALAQALKSGKLYAAGLDVLSSEPPSPDNPLLGLENCIITPHYAWASLAARQRLIDSAAKNLAAFLGDGPTINTL